MKRNHHRNTKKQKATAGDPRDYAKDIVMKELAPKSKFTKKSRTTSLKKIRDRFAKHGRQNSKVLNAIYDKHIKGES